VSRTPFFGEVLEVIDCGTLCESHEIIQLNGREHIGRISLIRESTFLGGIFEESEA
jgi:hypothetical protein